MCWSDLYVGVVKSRVRGAFLSMCVCVVTERMHLG